MNELETQVRAAIRDVPDFPRPGILFKDITPILSDAALFGSVCDWFAGLETNIDKIVGIESRGFPFAAPLVAPLNAGMVLARKKGKLPWNTVRQSYALEYGEATLELHQDSIQPGERVLIVDDLLATGGTARATVDLVRQLGGVVVS